MNGLFWLNWASWGNFAAKAEPLALLNHRDNRPMTTDTSSNASPEYSRTCDWSVIGSALSVQKLDENQRIAWSERCWEHVRESASSIAL
jgi:hypothetical protein